MCNGCCGKCGSKSVFRRAIRVIVDLVAKEYIDELRNEIRLQTDMIDDLRFRNDQLSVNLKYLQSDVICI
jgi:hypothetical protein